MTHQDVAGVIALSDPLVILDGIKQFGLAADGSDLRDLRAALESQAKALSEARSACDDAADLIKRQQGWQAYGEQLERDANAAMATEIQEQRRQNAELRDSLAEARRVIDAAEKRFDRIALCIQRNLYHQREKVEDATKEKT